MERVWSIDYARRLAAAHLSELGDRWAHVRGCGELAESLAAGGLVDDVVAAAAWLHDLGYALRLARTGFHPIDGAVYLRQAGAPDELVGLVAHHTGALDEAEERGLLDELEALPDAKVDDLDVVTLIDLSVGPSGSLTTPTARIDEILQRYGIEDPVHQAVTRSAPELLAAADRARTRLGLPDEWPL